MNKNHILLMKIFFRGTVTFGLGTIMTTIIFNLADLFTYKKLKTNQQLDDVESQTFLGFPLLVLWYIFLIIMVQIHAFSLYLANLLLHSWQQYKPIKKNLKALCVLCNPFLNKKRYLFDVIHKG